MSVDLRGGVARIQAIFERMYICCSVLIVDKDADAVCTRLQDANFPVERPCRGRDEVLANFLRHKCRVLVVDTDTFVAVRHLLPRVSLVMCWGSGEALSVQRLLTTKVFGPRFILLAATRLQ